MELNGLQAVKLMLTGEMVEIRLFDRIYRQFKIVDDVLFARVFSKELDGLDDSKWEEYKGFCLDTKGYLPSPE